MPREGEHQQVEGEDGEEQDANGGEDRQLGPSVADLREPGVSADGGEFESIGDGLNRGPVKWVKFARPWYRLRGASIRRN